MKIGDVFYVSKDEYSARGSDTKYDEIVITGETDKAWECSRGAVNKRSKKYRAWEDALTMQMYTKEEVSLREFDRKHRHKITEHVRYSRTCSAAMLKQVAELIGYRGELS